MFNYTDKIAGKINIFFQMIPIYQSITLCLVLMHLSPAEISHPQTKLVYLSNLSSSCVLSYQDPNAAWVHLSDVVICYNYEYLCTNDHTIKKAELGTKQLLALTESKQINIC